MSEKDLETIVMEVLASSEPVRNERVAVAANGQSGPLGIGGYRPALGRRKAFALRRPPRRSLRKPLRTSMRVIFVGLVVLCVPLLFL